MEKTDERVSHKLNHHVFVGSVAVVLVLILTASLPISFCSEVNYIWNENSTVDDFNDLFTYHRISLDGPVEQITNINVINDSNRSFISIVAYNSSEDVYLVFNSPLDYGTYYYTYRLTQSGSNVLSLYVNDSSVSLSFGENVELVIDNNIAYFHFNQTSVSSYPAIPINFYYYVNPYSFINFDTLLTWVGSVISSFFNSGALSPLLLVFVIPVSIWVVIKGVRYIRYLAWGC